MIEPRDAYQGKCQVRFIDALGSGKDGAVFRSEESHAVKFFFDADGYKRELRAYQILAEIGLDNVGGHQIPQLIRYDDELLAVEMLIVKPPYLIDFAAAYTEEEVEWFGFTEDVLQERELHWMEIFGDRWPQAASVRDQFQNLTGLILLDLSLNNVRFAD